MASRLNERDQTLLNAFQTKRVGEKPYEDGLWGQQGYRDFAYLEIYDDSNNLIDFGLARLGVKQLNKPSLYKRITKLIKSMFSYNLKSKVRFKLFSNNK